MDISIISFFTENILIHISSHVCQRFYEKFPMVSQIVKKKKKNMFNL